ncbi:hypothetical protein [Methanolapillus millepedarum]|uniref:Uncharacterized protein n=1 Tax=Methanolapillus millepedarum TaxID=3028296 RepID=A0AA96ZUF0_9EURY|nr:hypothetical protein MsAc7_10860 [Methanosarcinaceae archaeon Ac7]
MALRPTKIRLLELFQDGKPHWNYEIIEMIHKEYDMSGMYERDLINFDIIELASGGMIKDVEQAVDDKGINKKGFLMHRYVITDLGKDKVEHACIG